MLGGASRRPGFVRKSASVQTSSLPRRRPPVKLTDSSPFRNKCADAFPHGSVDTYQWSDALSHNRQRELVRQKMGGMSPNSCCDSAEIRSSSQARAARRASTSACESCSTSPCGDIRQYGWHLTPVAIAIGIYLSSIRSTIPARTVHSYLVRCAHLLLDRVCGFPPRGGSARYAATTASATLSA